MERNYVTVTLSNRLIYVLRNTVHKVGHYTAPDRGAEYCHDRVCLSVCPRAYLQKYTSDLYHFCAC